MTERLTGVKVVVLAENMYEDLELWYPVLRLRAAGASVQIAGAAHPSTYLGRKGYPVDTDCAASDVSIDEIAAVVVPGGYAPDLMRRNRAMVDLIRAANDKKKLIAAICHAGWLLVEADVLRGVRAACFFSIRTDVINAGATYVDADVVADGNFITSRTPADLPAFGEALVEYLALSVSRQRTQADAVPALTGASVSGEPPSSRR